MRFARTKTRLVAEKQTPLPQDKTNTERRNPHSLAVRAFQFEMSVDQDLTVVAEALDDDIVKRWLVSIVFTRA